ncbi:MAG: NAD(+) diphosphatase, partial [Acinetobacter sp.]|nr:NAD(+) diphosphatase [Acinetobacter sp.]
MSELSLAYIFHHQQLLVDQNFQLPKVEKLASDLLFTHDEQVIARDLLAEEPIPEGLQLVPIRQLITSWSKEQFLQASRAVQLLEWRRNHKFCSHCGHPTEVHPTEYAMVCPSCRYHQYPRVNPCIITVITRGDDEILLAKSVHNKTNMYGLIAGFVEVGETLEEAVQREAFEEVGLKLKNIQ